jgi:5-hydroxyisourate hydrolase
MTTVTTHVLDTARGAPAPGMAVTLASTGTSGGGHWTKLARELTDVDGRIAGFPDAAPGRWRLVFETGTPFFPEVVVTFTIEAGREHLHVPLLLSPYGYSVYRGS